MPDITDKSNTEHQIASPSRLAYRWGVSRQSVKDWSKDWLATAKIGRGAFDERKAHELYIQHRVLPQYIRTDEESESMDEAKRRKEIAVANMKEMEEQRLRGDLIERNEAIKWVTGLVAESKAVLLALPRRMAPVVYGKEVRDSESLLRKEVINALNKLSRVVKDNQS